MTLELGSWKNLENLDRKHLDCLEQTVANIDVNHWAREDSKPSEEHGSEHVYCRREYHTVLNRPEKYEP